MHGDATITTPTSVFITGNHHFEPTLLQAFAELHGSKAILGGLDETIGLVDKYVIHEVEFISGPKPTNRLESFLDPGLLIHQTDNGSVGRLTTKVGVIKRIASVGTSKPGGIGRILLDSLVHHQEVTLTLTHLLGVHEDMAIGVVPLGPKRWLVIPDSCMVIQCHRQVIRNKILGTNTEVHGVPVAELRPHLIEKFGRYVGILR
mmetsp:Transcript_6138/g.13383  ORF Transcript_6138/g.13383 Transcript_6138/m.13383 type:complete len:204 (+) Transcript_6138:678-1289(+)